MDKQVAGKPRRSKSAAPAAGEGRASLSKLKTKGGDGKAASAGLEGDCKFSGASAFAAAVARAKAADQSMSPKDDGNPEGEDVNSPGGGFISTQASPRLQSPSGTGSSRGFNTSYSVPSSPSSPRSHRRYAQIHAHGRQATAALNGAQLSASRPAKDLSLKQLRMVINSVYESKAQHEARCLETQEPTETMEQHLYDFLNRRYGVRSVVQEWAHAIFKAINRWSPQECDVAVFGKILQNSLAESFSSVQETLRSSVHMLLKKEVQLNNPNMQQTEIDNLWRSRLQRGVPLMECEKVVRYMYNERDSDAVLHRVKKAVAEWADNPKAEPDSVRYRDLVQILMRFQMELTEGFLADFVRTFADVDQDEDGIVDQMELRELMNRFVIDINLTSENASVAAASTLNEERLKVELAIRPIKRATFSECVDIFTGMISARWAILRSTRLRGGPNDGAQS